jgi:hypothetical protein
MQGSSEGCPLWDNPSRCPAIKMVTHCQGKVSLLVCLHHDDRHYLACLTPVIQHTTAHAHLRGLTLPSKIGRPARQQHS